MKIIGFVVLSFFVVNSQAQSDSIYKHEHEFKKNWVTADSLGKFTSHCDYEFHWPSFTGPHPVVKILNTTVAQLACVIEDSCHIDSLDKAFMEIRSDGLYSFWSEHIRTTSDFSDFILFMQINSKIWGDYFTLEFSDYDYTGGLHPRTFVAYKLINAKTASEVKRWQELFVDTTQILKLGEDIFLLEKGIKNRAEMYQRYSFSNGSNDEDFYLPQNFYLDKIGIHFFYNTYEIAAGAEGPTTLNIPYTVIDSYLKKSVRELLPPH